MAIVAGVDYGTLSVRVTLLDSARGRLSTASAEYPLHRKREDPDYATQSHADHMTALTIAMRQAIAEAPIEGSAIEALAIDTTGSSVIFVDEHLQPLDDYYLWCDHRAKQEAQQITALAHAENLEAIQWCGGTYSHEWGFAKLLHWLRHNPGRTIHDTAPHEACDWQAQHLCAVCGSRAGPNAGVCAMEHRGS